jgi:hypothetical protein
MGLIRFKIERDRGCIIRLISDIGGDGVSAYRVPHLSLIASGPECDLNAFLMIRCIRYEIYIGIGHVPMNKTKVRTGWRYFDVGFNEGLKCVTGFLVFFDKLDRRIRPAK